MELSKSQISELFNIGNNMPVFAGNVLSKEVSHELIELGLAMKYEGKYVLTERGKEELLRIKIEGAKMISSNSAVNKWAEK